MAKKQNLNLIITQSDFDATINARKVIVPDYIVQEKAILMVVAACPGFTLEEILMAVSGDNNITVLEEMVPKFSCDCSRERMEQALKTISEEERKKMIEQDGCIEMKCSFCGRTEKW